MASSSSSFSSMKKTSSTYSSSLPSNALEIPQTRNDLTMILSDICFHEAETQSMTFCLEGCFKLPREVFSPPLLFIQELHESRIFPLKGLLRLRFIGWTIEIQPPGIAFIDHDLPALFRLVSTVLVKNE